MRASSSAPTLRGAQSKAEELDHDRTEPQGCPQHVVQRERHDGHGQVFDGLPVLARRHRGARTISSESRNSDRSSALSASLTSRGTGTLPCGIVARRASTRARRPSKSSEVGASAVMSVISKAAPHRAAASGSEDLAILRWVRIVSLAESPHHFVDRRRNRERVFGHRPEVVIDVHANGVVPSGAVEHHHDRHTVVVDRVERQPSLGRSCDAYGSRPSRFGSARLGQNLGTPARLGAVGVRCHRSERPQYSERPG